ncbi:MAG TPA: VWA domain-containing protein [Thermomicrobiales bacterium]|nr:VWA domain-containing protein [Thermomicrobiales bacterium]
MPHRFPTSWRYSKWDGSEEMALDTDDLFDNISEDLLRDGDLDQALRRAFRWGMRGQDGSRQDGLRDLIDRLRQRRQDLLDRYDFDSVLGDLAERLQDIVDREHSTLDERLGQAQQGDGQQGAESGESGGQAGAQKGQQAGSQQGQPSGAGGQQGGGGEQDALRDFLERKRQRLDAIPNDAGSRIQQLQNYDFVDRQAGEDFEKLMEEMRQQITDSLFNNLMGAAQNTDAGPAGDLKDFLRDLNEAFAQEAAGQPVDMDALNNKWSHMFGGRADSLDEIRERMRQRMMAAQALMSLLSPEQRAELQAAMEQAIRDSGIEQELMELQEHLGPIPTPDMNQASGPGQEELPLDMAMDVMERANEMQGVEEMLRAMVDPTDLDGIPDEMLRNVLSEQDRDWLDQWSELRDRLIDEGYARRGRKGLELTPRAIRKIGEKALQDIFSSLKDLGAGEHDIHQRGSAGESADTSAPWQFGDPFLLDLPRTVMNGLMREGPGTPVGLVQDDFEVIEREAHTSTATALLIDMSRSMYYSGAWDAAKRSALALDTLIRGKYPRDRLELIGFSSVAHPLQMTDLPSLNWNEYTYGTNLQHALELARQTLRSERGSNRQIIVITDGEPTAHIEEGRPFFNYPPTWQTFEATLREVVRCTREGITINVFLLEHSPYMVRFVEDLMRINKGRVINASPTRLGSYVLRDFLQQRTLYRNG